MKHVALQFTLFKNEIESNHPHTNKRVLKEETLSGTMTSTISTSINNDLASSQLCKKEESNQNYPDEPHKRGLLLLIKEGN